MVLSLRLPQDNVLLDPDDGANISAGSSPPDETVDSGESPVTESADVGGDQAAASESEQPASSAPTTVNEVLKYLRSYGHDLPYQDDREFLSDAIQSLRDRQRLMQDARLAEQLKPHLPQFSQWLQAQQQAQQPQPAQPTQAERKGWFKGYDFDSSLERYIVRNEDGTFSAAPGADPAIVPRYQKWLLDRQEVARKLTENPEEFFKPFEEHLLNQVMEKVKESIQPVDYQIKAQQIVQQAQPWMIQHDEYGRPLAGADGRPALSLQGARYLHYVNVLAQNGYDDPVRQHQTAVQLMQNEFQAWSPFFQQQQQPQGVVQSAAGSPAQQASEAKKQQYVQSARRNGSRLNIPSASDEADEKRSLNDMLNRAFTEAGIN